MKELLATLREAAVTAVQSCRDEAEVEAVRIRYLGRKGELTTAVRRL
jgi:hypothetical protein